MKKIFTISALLAAFVLTTHAQEQKIKLDESNKVGSAKKSEIFTAHFNGESNTRSADLKWRPILTKKCTAFEPKIPNEELIEQIKAEKFLTKTQSFNGDGLNEKSTLIVNPIVGTNYLGNTNNGSAPLDNSIAISDGGIIVSVANTTIEVDDISGNNLYYNDLPTFFNDFSITTTCDPVVLYDKLADRFILFFQECSGNSSNSKLCICFSKTNNPATGGWWTYKITGDPLNDNSWFDYPKMAVSNNELYISGNLFNNSGAFNQAVLYQIQKSAGYSGGSLNWQYWYAIDGNPFTLLPVGGGQGQSYTPGCYLVAVDNSGSSNIKLYDLTDDLSGSPALNQYDVSTTAYSLASNSQQLGTTCLLDNNDCRALSGFYLNGIIHFVFHSDIGSGWNGINYNRLTVSSKTNQSSMFGSAGSYDYSYPSVSSFATSAGDKSVMINCGRASSTIYPEVRAVNCDDAMNWSSSVLVKSSSNYVSMTSASVERWGDYTGAARKHNSSVPSIWICGSIGNSSNTWDAWNAEIHGGAGSGISSIMDKNEFNVFPNPVVESFNITFTLKENTELQIEILDVNGKLVKELYNGKGLEGDNSFSFNKANLSNGTYFLVIKNNSIILKNEKIIIAD